MPTTNVNKRKQKTFQKPFSAPKNFQLFGIHKFFCKNDLSKKCIHCLNRNQELGLYFHKFLNVFGVFPRLLEVIFDINVLIIPDFFMVWCISPEPRMAVKKTAAIFCEKDSWYQPTESEKHISTKHFICHFKH